MKFNGTDITKESVAACREWFANNADEIIKEAKSGLYHVNDLQAWVNIQEQRKVRAMAGEFDHTLTFMQRAYYIQTGESVALLP